MDFYSGINTGVGFFANASNTCVDVCVGACIESINANVVVRVLMLVSMFGVQISCSDVVFLYLYILLFLVPYVGVGNLLLY